MSLTSRIVPREFCSDDGLKADYRHSQKYSLFLVKIHFLKENSWRCLLQVFPITDVLLVTHGETIHSKKADLLVLAHYLTLRKRRGSTRSFSFFNQSFSFFPFPTRVVFKNLTQRSMMEHFAKMVSDF